jgi:TPR repeat protein
VRLSKLQTILSFYACVAWPPRAELHSIAPKRIPRECQMRCVFCAACRSFFSDSAHQKVADALLGERGEDEAEIWEREPDLARLRSAYHALATEPRRALTELRELAQIGSAMSMMYLGNALERGIGTEVDLRQAATWFDGASKAGCALALAHLGCVQSELRDYGQAIETFTRGIAGGDRLSVYFLGSLFKSAPEPFRDMEKARELLARAADWGNVYAQRQLASLLMGGHDGVVNRLRGLQLLFLSARRGLAMVAATDRQALARSADPSLRTSSSSGGPLHEPASVSRP